MAAVLVLHV